VKLTEADIDTLLSQTFDDQRLSRGERRALVQLVDNPPELRLRVQRRSFEIAKTLADTAPFATVLAWLEEVQKALTEDSSSGTAPDMTDEPDEPGKDEATEAIFSPHQDVCRRIIAALGRLTHKAELAVFTITDDRITRAILEAHRRGVTIRIVSDNDKANDLGSDIQRLASSGLAVRIDRTPVHMHHKFAVLDDRTLLNGSYNWTRGAALENHENVVFHTSPALLTAFKAEFEHCWKLAEPF